MNECRHCGFAIELISPTNTTPYWRHLGRTPRHIAEPTPSLGPWIPGPEDLAKFRDDPEVVETSLIPNQSNLQYLWESGLVWMINASILHPRGYALAAVFDDADEETVIGLTIVGDGSEPWCFGETKAAGTSGKFKTFESDKSYRNFAASEQKRERDWSPKLNPPVKTKFAPLEGRTPEMIDKEVLDLRDPEVEKEFLRSLKEYGVGQTDQPIETGISYAFTDNLDEMQHEMIQKTIARQLDNTWPELCMHSYAPPYPADYKFCYKPRGHEGGHIYSVRRRDFDAD